ncbi:MAG TPA: D-glycero-beta-D-manno-heptose 1-phosphate adenylyltransferase [Ignavibacteriales bacterium]|nr:D-glycero-beta-D-manno-heptose 1-phosphate adenylyltransferase [Ignavibacteriales bacterium]
MNNIISADEFLKIRKTLKEQNKKIVFTNGCFDILHAGHVDYLIKAKAMGDALVVGMNSDSSIQRIKGPKRPVVPERERAFIIANLKAVDYVIFFYEDTPGELINKIIPDVLVKGADWSIDNIVGRDVVVKNGGEVKTIEFVNDTSTTKIIEKVLESYKT